MGYALANAHRNRHGTIFLTAKGYPTPLLITMSISVPLLLVAHFSPSSSPIDPDRLPMLLSVVVSIATYQATQAAKMGKRNERKEKLMWTVLTDEYKRGDLDHVLNVLNRECVQDDPSPTATIECVVCLGNLSSKIAESKERASEVLEVILDKVVPDFNDISKSNHLSCRKEEGSQGGKDKGESNKVSPKMASNVHLLLAVFKLLQTLPPKTLGEFLGESPDSLPPLASLLKSSLVLTSSYPSYDGLIAKLLSSLTMFLASASSSNPSLTPSYLGLDLPALIVPAIRYFPLDVKLQRNALLLLFNLSYDNALGKGQIVRCHGVPAMIQAVKSCLASQDPGAEVPVVHGMGCLFDILRSPPYPPNPADEGTCLSGEVIKGVREMAMKEGIKELLGKVKEKDWNIKGVELKNMAEIMMTGME
ncbi:hypothetical protein TrRE_jg3584 [Triparma retinervis]|uniref:ARM repeat superfamily protein n=1 Tax=Triparma retinervis TaxID=2557542 RepID=A0A9W7G8S4_9STRA|nr:hypothetical protein TrRE_jg3584 [Triparma retinervis]